MDKELKAKWVEALRSGEYKQGFGRLKDEERFCCLGVLCLVKGMPVDEIENWSGWYSTLHPEVDKGKLDVLWGMNDGSGPNANTFAQIADYIEREL